MATALRIDFNICQEECETLVFTETTGVYSSTNLYGWNDASTEDVGNAADAVLFITFPDGTSISPPLTLYPALPTSDTDVEYEISSEDVGLTGDFPDGIYTFKYVVTMDDETQYTKTCYVFLTCQADCCIEKLYAKVSPTDCKDCKDSKLSFAVEAEGFLHAAKSRANCGETAAATALLAKVQYMCNLEKCNC